MLKKSIITASITILLALVLFMVYSIVEKVYTKKSIAEKNQTLSAPTLFKMDSSRYQFTLTSPVLLIYFNTECEHCQYELAELKKNLSAFQQISILLMSSENISVIKRAMEAFGVAPHVGFVKINRDDVFESFGSLSVPHLFLYGSDRKLIKEFKGETKMEAILKYLP
jgi:thioredoxin-related protein